MTNAVWPSFVCAFSVAAAIGDVLYRKISRWMTVLGLVVGLAFQGYSGRFLNALGTACLAFAIGAVLFAMGAIGGGDVKLITALGAMIGLHPWLRAMLIAVFVAAAIALFQMIRHRVFHQTLQNIVEICRNFLRHGFVAHPEINVNNPGLIRAPFGLAIAAGVLATVL